MKWKVVSIFGAALAWVVVFVFSLANAKAGVELKCPSNATETASSYKDANGKIVFVYACEDKGIKYGPFVEYYDRDKKRKRAQGEYYFGVRVGTYYSWHPSGYKKEKIEYAGPGHEGVRRGESTEWYESGSLKEQAHYKNGMLHGLLQKWHSNGRLIYSGNFEEGRGRGSVKVWDEHGFLVSASEVLEDGIAYSTEHPSVSDSVQKFYMNIESLMKAPEVEATPKPMAEGKVETIF